MQVYKLGFWIGLWVWCPYTVFFAKFAEAVNYSPLYISTEATYEPRVLESWVI